MREQILKSTGENSKVYVKIKKTYTLKIRTILREKKNLGENQEVPVKILRKKTVDLFFNFLSFFLYLAASGFFSFDPKLCA